MATTFLNMQLMQGGLNIFSMGSMRHREYRIFLIIYQRHSCVNVLDSAAFRSEKRTKSVAIRAETDSDLTNLVTH